MMRDAPQGVELLVEARRVLANKVLPQLASETRYQVLMAIRAITLAEREFEASAETEEKLGEMLQPLLGSDITVPELTQLLSKRIRNGDFDQSEKLYAFLRLAVAFKLKETDPSKVWEELEDSLNRLQAN
jgi:hypothetical protein